MRAVAQRFIQADQSLPAPMDLSALHGWGKGKGQGKGKDLKIPFNRGRRETREAPAKERTKEPEINLHHLKTDKDKKRWRCQD
eukprot:5807768-Amphidinium_carterae.1